MSGSLVQLPANAHLPISQELSDDGTDSGTVNPIGNFGGANTAFYFIQPPAGEVYIIHRMLIQIVDGTIVAEDYGGLGAALGEGINFYVLTSADNVVKLLHTTPITTNAHYAHLCYDISNSDWGNPAASDWFTARWTFTKFNPPGIILTDQMKLAVLLDDDFTGLIAQRFMVQGANVSRDHKGILIK